MARYTVTPYRVSVHPHGSVEDLLDVGQILPDWSLLRLFGSAAAAHQGGPYCMDDFETSGRSLDFSSPSTDRQESRAPC